MKISSDFEFWVEKSPEDLPYSDDSEDHLLACSPSFPSRSYQHEYSCPSPTSRLRAIVNGRRELMEMIKDIPESQYELSLKDIVEDKHSNEREKNGTLTEKRNSNKAETRSSRKSKIAGRNQISRTQSMDSGVYLLKMSLPIPSCSKKNPKERTCAKISPGPSSEGSEKHANKDWWKTIFSSVKDRNKKSINIRRSSSDITSSKTSMVESNFVPRQSSLNSKKYKSSDKEGAYSNRIAVEAREEHKCRQSSLNSKKYKSSDKEGAYSNRIQKYKSSDKEGAYSNRIAVEARDEHKCRQSSLNSKKYKSSEQRGCLF